MSNPETPQPSPVMEVTDIMSVLPHRYPFLMLDRVIELERRARVVAVKNVTMNEPYFQGHFPGQPILPGVMVIEGMAQAGGMLVLLDVPDRHDKLMVFTGIEKARFRRMVVPGDQLRIEVTVLHWRSRMVRLAGTATVDGQIACEATLLCGLTERTQSQFDPGPPMGHRRIPANEAKAAVNGDVVRELVTVDAE